MGMGLLIAAALVGVAGYWVVAALMVAGVLIALLFLTQYLGITLTDHRPKTGDQMNYLDHQLKGYEGLDETDQGTDDDVARD